MPLALRIGLAAALLVAAAPADVSADAEPADATLENGLRVLVRPFPAAESVALVLVFRVGEAHDPPGRSGLGHLAEHVFVTGAAGDRPARTVAEVAAAYRGWNAQTSFDYTLVATVFPPERLDLELADAAARMGGGVRVERAVFERERARIVEEELPAMYERVPRLVAGNRARDLLFPPAPGTRRGGTGPSLARIEPADVAAHLRFHAPLNAIVAVAGAVERGAALAACRRAFGALPPGPAPPAAAAFPAPAAEPGRLETACPDAPLPPAPPLAAACFPAPRPDEAAYAPFLLGVVRLALASRATRCQVIFPPFEDGRALTISSPDGPEALARFLERDAPPALAAPVRPHEVEVAVSWVFGHATPTTPYEAAFRAAMALHSGAEPAALRRRLSLVGPADVSRALPAGPGWRARGALVTVRGPQPSRRAESKDQK